MATSFAVEILNAKLNANFKGVALGDSWIDPKWRYNRAI